MLVLPTSNAKAAEAVEALCAAGFELAEDGDETVLLLKDGFDAARLDAATKTVAAAKALLAK